MTIVFVRFVARCSECPVNSALQLQYCGHNAASNRASNMINIVGDASFMLRLHRSFPFGPLHIYIDKIRLLSRSNRPFEALTEIPDSKIPNINKALKSKQQSA